MSRVEMMPRTIGLGLATDSQRGSGITLTFPSLKRPP
jgi:hypothetical protein